MLRILSVLSMLLLIFFVLVPGSYAGSSKGGLRLALLPIPDVLPVYVALEKGYFKELGLEIIPLSVGSAVERDQLMQAGKVDGMINEISGAANFNREKQQVKIISVARSPLGDSPLFRIVGAPGTGLKTPEDLAGVPIGISKNTVIEYISTRMLIGGGLQPDQIKYKSVPVLPERLQLLLQGQLKAATLPDPLGAAALKAGAVELMSDLTRREVSQSVITFTTDALVHKKEMVENFMLGWDRASKDINKDPESYRALMLEKIRVPKNVRDDFAIPSMPRKALPSKAQWDDVMDWMVQRKLLATPLRYEDSVTADFLPK